MVLFLALKAIAALLHLVILFRMRCVNKETEHLPKISLPLEHAPYAAPAKRGARAHPKEKRAST